MDYKRVTYCLDLLEKLEQLGLVAGQEVDRVEHFLLFPLRNHCELEDVITKAHVNELA